MRNDNTFWLKEFMCSVADGEWEHCDGIRITGLENPGWEISVDLEGKGFKDLSIRRTEHNWLDCRIERFKFLGFCGPRNLNELIQVFRDWVERQRN